MLTSYLPPLLIPIVGIFLPIITMASLFISIEKDKVE